MKGFARESSPTRVTIKRELLWLTFEKWLALKSGRLVSGLGTRGAELSECPSRIQAAAAPRFASTSTET
eukprot:scaffold270276_cov18-Prasinocladus_malaysianus.AAC.1